MNCFFESIECKHRNTGGCSLTECIYVKTTQKKELPTEFKEEFKKFVKEQKSLPIDFIEIINDNFWDLI